MTDQVKHLSTLTPAETLLVLEADHAPWNELLKVTFMDLLLKQVIQIEEVEKQPSRHDPIRIYKYIAPGKNFLDYKPLSHERVFLAIFQKEFRVRVLFQNLVKIGFEKAESVGHYQSTIAKSPSLKSHITKRWFQVFTDGITITDAGFELKRNLQKEINYLEREFSRMLTQKPQQAFNLLKLVKGNIFLLSTIDFDLMHQLDRELLEQFKNYKRGDNTQGGCTWTTFDSGCSSSGCSNDSSGCSSDSGCSSGCSGCGGGCGSD